LKAYIRINMEKFITAFDWKNLDQQFDCLLCKANGINVTLTVLTVSDHAKKHAGVYEDSDNDSDGDSDDPGQSDYGFRQINYDHILVDTGYGLAQNIQIRAPNHGPAQVHIQQHQPGPDVYDLDAAVKESKMEYDVNGALSDEQALALALEQSALDK